MISAPQARKFWEAKMITILITLGGGGVWPMITIDYVRGWGGLESRNHDYVILKRSLSVGTEMSVRLRRERIVYRTYR